VLAGVVGDSFHMAGRAAHHVPAHGFGAAMDDGAGGLVDIQRQSVLGGVSIKMLIKYRLDLPAHLSPSAVRKYINSN